ncbi:hypothetical protein [Hyphobacterium sp.]|jgi:hypothetical protein|uniref:hypothetical protein n=1 Tax=Hyphobacterium sp. TaxID=2004662 RepID=UPI003BAB0C52
MMRRALALAALTAGMAQAQAPGIGEGVVAECAIEQARLTESELRLTCDPAGFDRSGLNDEMIIQLGNETRDWLAERTLHLMELATRDSRGRPVLDINIMYQGSGSPGRIMDVRAVYADGGRVSPVAGLRNPRGGTAVPSRVRGGTRPSNPTGGTATPQQGQGGVIHCRIETVQITEQIARFECDESRLDQPGFDHRAEIDHQQSAQRRWLLERALDLMASAPEENGAPAIAFNVMFQGSGRAGRIMDVRARFDD